MIETIGDCIWKVTGPESGPNIVVFGGTHGNELTGIEIVRKMHKQIESGELNIDRGTLYLILGNPKAIVRETRGSEDHADLNRCFKRDILSSLTEGEDGGGSVKYELERAKEIAQILKDADVSIDLHATNKPSVPFLCCIADEKHERVYRWFECDRVLADPRYILGGEPVTTDEFIDLNGGVGLCYETGYAGDTTRIDAVYENVLSVLKDQDMIDSAPTSSKDIHRSVYELVEVIKLTEAGFRYAENFGNGSFEEFKAGQTIAFIGNEPVIADFDGVFVFPKLPEYITLGKPVVYLAKQIH